MTETEKRAFHTEVYAFRAVFLDVQEEKSPVDPKGDWFDREAVMRLTRVKYNKRELVRRERAAARDLEMRREGLDIVDAWAKDKGFDSIDAYCDANHVAWVDVYTEIVQQICSKTLTKDGDFMPRRIGRWRLLADCIGGGGKGSRPPRAIPSAAASLGVTAREYSADEMRAAREELGLGLGK